MIDKKKLLSYMIVQLKKDLEAAILAARATYEAATHEESKPENEYDTRSLEASYLAGAQAKRAGEIEELLTICQLLEVQEFKQADKITSTALIEVEHQDQIQVLFLLPKGGGQVIQFDGKTIHVITPSSPLGEALLGLQVGDSAIVEMGMKTKEYEIISIS